ncbi:MAG: hypothetical protein JXA28_15200, partial [Bacteroidetes bacterium]|nr:hypothetical protein [Bacteroidota bacterium]
VPYVSAAYALDTQTLLLADRYSLLLSTDGTATWEERTSGIFIPDWHLTMDDIPDYRLICTPRISTDRGTNWFVARSDSGRFLSGQIYPFSDGSMFFVGTTERGNSGLWSSSDDGITWKQRHAAPFKRYYSLFMSDDPAEILAVEDYTDVYASGDRGMTWERRGTLPRDSTGLRLFEIRTMRAPHDDIALAAVGIKGIFRSTNRGADWTPVEMDGTGEVWVKRIFELPDGTLIAVSWFDIFRSKDQGETWDLVQTASLPDNIGTVIPDRLGNIYEYRPNAGSPQSLWMFTSRDGGAHWSPLNIPPPPVPEPDIQAITFDDQFRLLVTTKQSGIFRLRNPVLKAEGLSPVASAVSIDALYPQPLRCSQADAGDMITVRCFIPSATSVQWTVADLLGRVRTGGTHDATAPGSQQFRASLPTLAPGIYVLQLQSTQGSAATTFPVIR